MRYIAQVRVDLVIDVDTAGCTPTGSIWARALHLAMMASAHNRCGCENSILTTYEGTVEIVGQELVFLKRNAYFQD